MTRSLFLLGINHSGASSSKRNPCQILGYFSPRTTFQQHLWCSRAFLIPGQDDQQATTISCPEGAGESTRRGFFISLTCVYYHPAVHGLQDQCDICVELKWFACSDSLEAVRERDQLDFSQHSSASPKINLLYDYSVLQYCNTA